MEKIWNERSKLKRRIIQVLSSKYMKKNNNNNQNEYL